MKPGRGPTQIFLGVEPLKLVCKMQPVRPAVRKDVGTPARGRFCSLLVRPPHPSPAPGPGVSQRLRLGYSSGQWAPGSTCVGTAGAEGATRGREERYSRGQPGGQLEGAEAWAPRSLNGTKT